MMFEFYHNILCVNGGLLYKDNNPVITFSDYKNIKNRYAKTIRVGGHGRTALLDFQSLPERIKTLVIERYGDPYTKDITSFVVSRIKPDLKADKYFQDFKLPDGRNLPEPTQREYLTNSQLLNVCAEVIQQEKGRKKLMGKSRLTQTWQQLAEAIEQLDKRHYPHTLPSNPRSLSRKFKKYSSKGYATLVHKNYGNGHATKIEGPVADWILATYMLPNKVSIPMLHHQYKSIYKENNWPSLSESAISTWLDKDEVRQVWRYARDGREAWANDYQHHIKRDRSNWFPNAFWAIDGTKLDWLHYCDKNGRAAKMRINVLIDVYSEKILGWSLSETEDHTDHFKALKMAFKNAQSKPYLLNYDNQSGHKSSRMQQLYDKAVAKNGGTHFPNKANRHTNPIEQVFNRFQQQNVNLWWFSDGQSIKVREDRNKLNPDFIKENTHKLPTKDKILKAWKITVQQWNRSVHPHFEALTRAEVYNQNAPMSEPVTFLDMIDMFWIENPRQVTYERGGLEMTVAKKRYEFEVYDADNKIDINFRKKYVGAKFTVKYDPEDLTIIRLYKIRPDKKLEYIANATTKRGHENIPALMQDGDKSLWDQDYQVRQEEEQKIKERIAAIQANTGINPNRLIEEQELILKMGGAATKEDRNKAENNNFLEQL